MISNTSFLSLRGTRFLAYASEQAPQSLLLSLRGAEGNEAIPVEGMGSPRPDRSGLAMTQEVITQRYEHMKCHPSI